MSVREQHRTWVLTRVARGELTMAEAAGRLALSERQLWRLRAAFERDGPAGLVHHNRGRPSPRRIEASLRARVIELRRTRYVEVNDTHFGELLAEHEAIALSRECLRQMLRADGIASPRRRRAPKHRSRRERMAAEGLLLQLDGSRHDWLEGRGPWLTLVGAIDDATGSVPGATFRDQEDAAAYLEILRTTITAHGLPGALYHDRHSAFAPTSPGRAAPGGTEELSQVGRALVELGIGSILARSPQAKGRIERLWGTFQDRLVTELRLAGVVDRAGANALLAAFLPRFKRPLRGAGRGSDAGLAAGPGGRPARPGAGLQVPLQGRPRPHDPARRTDPPAAGGTWRAGLCRAAGRGPRPARWNDRRVRRGARAAGDPGPSRSRPASRRRPAPSGPKSRSRGRSPALGPTWRSSLATRSPGDEALPTATDRITRQLS